MNKRRRKGGDLAFLNKTVRVVSECANEGRVGRVHKIYRELAERKCHVVTDRGGFDEKLEKLELDVPGKPEPCGIRLDFRRLKQSLRESIRHKLEGRSGNLEPVVHGELLEQSTVAAMLEEMELRLVPEETVIVPPSVATPWGLFDIAHDVAGEVAAEIINANPITSELINHANSMESNANPMQQIAMQIQ